VGGGLAHAGVCAESDARLVSIYQPHGMTIARATDILWTYSSPEVYDLLVKRSGWTLQRYSAFIAAGIAAHLAG
jgi:hypothetical protein